MKLENRVGNWKYEITSEILEFQNQQNICEIRKNYQKWRNSSAGLKDYFKLQNEFQRFLTAEPVTAEEAAKRTFFRKTKGKFIFTLAKKFQN